jgi:hypothetical protein
MDDSPNEPETFNEWWSIPPLALLRSAGAREPFAQSNFPIG